MFRYNIYNSYIYKIKYIESKNLFPPNWLSVVNLMLISLHVVCQIFYYTVTFIVIFHCRVTL